MTVLQLETTGHGGIIIKSKCSAEAADEYARKHKRACCKQHQIELWEVDTETGAYVGTAPLKRW